jgi:hypothetical protein
VAQALDARSFLGPCYGLYITGKRKLVVSGGTNRGCIILNSEISGFKVGATGGCFSNLFTLSVRLWHVGGRGLFMLHELPARTHAHSCGASKSSVYFVEGGFHHPA